jgi:hypothetical protein
MATERGREAWFGRSMRSEAGARGVRPIDFMLPGPARRRAHPGGGGSSLYLE